MPDLSDGVNWSEIDANNNQTPPNGWPEGMMPSMVNDAARADRGAMKRFWDKLNPVQTVTPAGTLWTFTTSNIAYPAAYVDGEIYCFRPGNPSVGGDQFQVNELPAKAIYKHTAPGPYPGSTWVPIVAQDIVESVAAQLVYLASHDLFVLLNPHIPIVGDGSGGLSVPGALSVTGQLTVDGAPNIVANGLTIQTGGLGVTGDSGFNNNLTVVGNLTVEGLLNGHPAVALDTLAARIASLEATVADLRARMP